ncbi:MAG TPA: homocysteine S-methyltransferase family protein, partial [Myxococcota bacterium]|nr:homocysteine S-methyltransferase family protein [Myxococcota bacterium]
MTPAHLVAHAPRSEQLRALLERRILVIDGAMGTMIQGYKLGEREFRGTQYRDHGTDVRGCSDILSVTQPQIIEAIHTAYLQAGADIIETNSFTATRIALADYTLEAEAYAINKAAAACARRAVDALGEAGQGRFLAGFIGPTNRTASISPDVNDPGARNVTFEQLAATYEEAARGLVDGGADILMIETIFDTLNAKAAIFAVESLFDALGRRLPVMIS